MKQSNNEDGLWRGFSEGRDEDMQLYVPQEEAALTSYERWPQKHRENLYPGL